MNERLLDVKDLYVSIDTYAGEVQAVRGVSLYLNQGETLAIVGESGSGKSVTVQTIMALNPMPPTRIKSGSIVYKGKDLTKLSDKEMDSYRGKELAMIFQDPMTSLNPTMKVGKQIAEGILLHEKISRKEAMDRALEMLKLVGIPNPEENLQSFPHTYSGGMRQRIMIAIALACNPNILIADEPTTALDVTIQAQILDLMNDLKKKLDTGIILITHDLGVVARMSDRIAVMYGGTIVESGTTDEIFYEPLHPYTWGLLSSIPSTSGQSEGKELVAIPGTPPDLLNPPKGCPFAARCTYCMNVCTELQPPISETETGHYASCWLLDEQAPSIDLPKFNIKKEAECDE